MTHAAFPTRLAVLLSGTMALFACGGEDPRNFDFDFRGAAGQLDTTAAVRAAIDSAPTPGERSENLAQPRRVPAAAAGSVSVVELAGSAIDRADGSSGASPASAPVYHRVVAGETMFTIARLYGVSAESIAEQNGLDPSSELQVGRYIVIPPAETAGTIETTTVAMPGSGSETPLPPSASQPLPTAANGASAPAARPAELEGRQTAASDRARLRMPVQGSIVRPFQKGSNEGIGISAVAGTVVVAADAGTVAAITRDTDQVPILVLRHEGNLLTVYAGLDEIAVEKGDWVKRGQKIAVVRNANPPFLHFEVREGFDSVDPGPYLN
ncbi:MAG: M23 family metallopeptidase [Boseongicola sp.]|nr:M23 family metallopeptidase [Boseongicola sp.]MDE0345527.1 M23 family metallopeptidase [Boseongicola sp.]MYI68787.1 M23 family metallopeptidase [Boseongicola sp. SB0673_bin_14]